MRIFRIIKTLYNIVRGPDKNYNKGMNSTIDALSDLVEIGDGFISAPGSIILAHDASTVTHTGKLRVEKTVIGKNVFLGANAVVLPGVTVGDNSIIGAGAVVTKDVPQGVVVAGNPAKFMCTVDNYMLKCKDRNVLYAITDVARKKHGTGVRMTEEESQELIEAIYKQFYERNK